MCNSPAAVCIITLLRTTRVLAGVAASRPSQVRGRPCALFNSLAVARLAAFFFIYPTDDYPGECYPGDVMAALMCIKRSDHRPASASWCSFDPPTAVPVLLRWQAACSDDPVRLETAPYKLALDAESCEIRARWNGANQIWALRFLPERVRLLLLSSVFFPIHTASIEWQY